MLTELLGDLFHKDDHLTDGQMILRAAITFVLAIALVRLAGRRSFGMRSPFDTVISLLLGAILSRAVVGASSFTGTVGACAVLSVLHRLLAYACLNSPALSRLVSGKDKVLYENGRFNRSDMSAMLVSEQDIQEAVRRDGNEVSLQAVKAVFIERNGQLSVVKKQPQTQLKGSEV